MKDWLNLSPHSSDSGDWADLDGVTLNRIDKENKQSSFVTLEPNKPLIAIDVPKSNMIISGPSNALRNTQRDIICSANGVLELASGAPCTPKLQQEECFSVSPVSRDHQSPMMDLGNRMFPRIPADIPRATIRKLPPSPNIPAVQPQRELTIKERAKKDKLNQRSKAKAAKRKVKRREEANHNVAVDAQEALLTDIRAQTSAEARAILAETKMITDQVDQLTELAGNAWISSFVPNKTDTCIASSDSQSATPSDTAPGSPSRRTNSIKQEAGLELTEVSDIKFSHSHEPDDIDHFGIQLQKLPRNLSKSVDDTPSEADSDESEIIISNEREAANIHRTVEILQRTRNTLDEEWLQGQLEIIDEKIVHASVLNPCIADRIDRVPEKSGDVEEKSSNALTKIDHQDKKAERACAGVNKAQKVKNQRSHPKKQQDKRLTSQKNEHVGSEGPNSKSELQKAKEAKEHEAKEANRRAQKTLNDDKKVRQAARRTEERAKKAANLHAMVSAENARILEEEQRVLALERAQETLRKAEKVELERKAQADQRAIQALEAERILKDKKRWERQRLAAANAKRAREEAARKKHAEEKQKWEDQQRAFIKAKRDRETAAHLTVVNDHEKLNEQPITIEQVPEAEVRQDLPREVTGDGDEQDKITVGKVVANKIATDDIAADDIAADEIAADEIAADDIAADESTRDSVEEALPQQHASQIAVVSQSTASFVQPPQCQRQDGHRHRGGHEAGRNGHYQPRDRVHVDIAQDFDRVQYNDYQNHYQDQQYGYGRNQYQPMETVQYSLQAPYPDQPLMNSDHFAFRPYPMRPYVEYGDRRRCQGFPDHQAAAHILNATAPQFYYPPVNQARNDEEILTPAVPSNGGITATYFADAVNHAREQGRKEGEEAGYKRAMLEMASRPRSGSTGKGVAW